MERELKLAVLIDAENISSRYVNVILSEANNLGNVIYKRIYGDWTSTQMNSWKETLLNYSIQPIQQYSNVSGKNSSDSSLIIDAMDLLYQGRLDGFCIVSSDSDFTRLAVRLREAEMYVLGMGEQKTPRSFISACNKFSYLDILYNAGAKQETPPAAAAGTGKKAAAEKDAPREKKAAAAEKTGSDLRSIRKALRELTEENSDDDGWILSGMLGQLLIRQFPDFDVRNFGSKKFVPFVQSLGLFETRALCNDENNGSKIVSFKLK
jgi:ribosomal protein L12E/L44/L45/RPP1/RPP2